MAVTTDNNIYFNKTGGTYPEAGIAFSTFAD
jgi:CRISPR/Cas system-associated protein Csm6